jgi:hypothetical protein
MMPSPETQPVARRSRLPWVLAIGAVVVLAFIAVVAVVAFLRLELLRPPTLEPSSGAGNAPIEAPVPTDIRPWLHAPPSTWDDRVG